VAFLQYALNFTLETKTMPACTFPTRTSYENPQNQQSCRKQILSVCKHEYSTQAARKIKLIIRDVSVATHIHTLAAFNVRSSIRSLSFLACTARSYQTK